MNAFAQPGQGPSQESLGPQTSQSLTGSANDCKRSPTGGRKLTSTLEKQALYCDQDNRAVINIATEPRSGEKPTSTSEKIFLSSFWSWLFGWQFLTFFFLALFFLWPSRLKLLLSYFESFKLFGTEFVLNRVSGEGVEERVAALRQREKEKFDSAITQGKIILKFQTLVQECIKPHLEQFDSLEIRATIHVQDLLFADALYQLLDYYPHQGSGRGRSFSSRSGIIGKAWRLGESQYAEVVPVDEKKLILDWGMTRAEAEDAGHGRKSFACVVLGNADAKLGLVFFDSPSPKAFGENKDSKLWNDLEASITKGATETGLIMELSKLYLNLIRPSAFIHIFTRS
jgi:hypothetical protein